MGIQLAKGEKSGEEKRDLRKNIEAIDANIRY
jgi:hypothetical protein